MGNLCCGEDDVPRKQAKQSVSGAAPPKNVMTPTASQRREQALQAAEERARKDAVRGTQRTRPKPKPKTYDRPDVDGKKGTDIADWM
ncbi:hypothetical protein BWQ96_06945 [Gracilariopsis chorda]|uniref:Uncharacterized protein n=1 Tax=Gracilariopsis chorda TaxID=448386 RepID=A0A2V3IMJ6_9FLOR|nr:hypothetical protein BWQ96_06945 [Gracilariopsis chorda]|eukprot:PXF43306.1 hypothetical protein BWQ96_06945 [Gracilariopsis chorda]